jgi:hypothetical protein
MAPGIKRLLISYDRGDQGEPYNIEEAAFRFAKLRASSE